MANDAELMKKFIEAGDRDALGELTKRHERMVYNVTMSVMKDADKASDATQQVFLSVIRRGKSFRKDVSFKGWLCRIAMNQALDMKRKERRRTRHEAGAAAARKESSMEPDEKVFRKELKQAVTDLPDEYRMPVELHYYHGLTRSEAAVALDCPEGTVATRLRAAIEKLRTRLKQSGFGAFALKIEEMLGTTGTNPVPPAISAGISTLVKTMAVPAGMLSKAGVVKMIFAVKVAFGLLVGAGVLGVFAWTAANTFRGDPAPGGGYAAMPVLGEDGKGDPAGGKRRTGAGKKAVKEPGKTEKAAGKLEWGKEVNGLRASLSCDGKKYPDGEKIELNVVIENTSDNDVYICTRHFPSGFKAVGAGVKQGGGVVWPGHTSRMKRKYREYVSGPGRDEFVLIEKGGRWKTRLDNHNANESFRGGIHLYRLGVGECEVGVSYEPDKKAKEAAERLGIKNLWYGKLETNTLKLEIVENKYLKEGAESEGLRAALKTDKTEYKLYKRETMEFTFKLKNTSSKDIYICKRSFPGRMIIIDGLKLAGDAVLREEKKDKKKAPDISDYRLLKAGESMSVKLKTDNQFIESILDLPDYRYHIEEGGAYSKLKIRFEFGMTKQEINTAKKLGLSNVWTGEVISNPCKITVYGREILMD